MPRIVIATACCFDLSPDAVTMYAERKGTTLHVVGKSFSMYDYAHVPAEQWHDLLARQPDVQSDEQHTLWAEEYNATKFDVYDIARDDPDLVAVIEQLGDGAAGPLSALSIVDVPDDVQWHIAECCGTEWVAEDHRRWGLE